MVEIWAELGDTMRQLRRASGESLRQLEAESMWHRGTLSEVETGKSRPSQELIDYYDTRFAGDGLLQSLYAEAHAISPVVGPLLNRRPERQVAGDAMDVLESAVPAGVLVQPGAEFVVGWTLRNAGSVPWIERGLVRVGASAGARLIAGPPEQPMPDAAPGHTVDVVITLVAPEFSGTVAAHWRMVHANGDFCFSANERLVVTAVVR